MSILENVKTYKADPLDIYTCTEKNLFFGGNHIRIFAEGGIESLECPLCGKLHSYYSNTKNPVVKKKPSTNQLNRRATPCLNKTML